MCWKTVILLLLLLAAVMAAGVIVQAQEITPFPPSPHPPDCPSVRGTAGPPRWETFSSAAPQAGRGAISDECSNAISVTLTAGAPSFADGVLTTGATITDTDPIQSCAWGGPAVNSNSVWWRVTVPEDGRLSVSSITENPGRYDTVVTIYPAAAGCGSLNTGNELGCDDDSHAFQSQASALVDGGEAYLVQVTGWGENNEGGDLDLFLHFALDTHWQYPSGTGLPIPLTRHVTVSDGEYLYLVGGWRPPDQKHTYRYDLRADTWSALEEMPVSYSNTDGVYVDGRIYIPSGYAGSSPYEGVHYTYTISDDIWSTLSAAPWGAEPIAWGAAAADPSDTAYYYTGGRYASTPDVPLPNVLQYDIISDTWHTLLYMNTPRYAHRAAFLGDELCVVGGIGGGGQPLAGGECFNFDSQSWSPTADLNIPRSSFGSAVGADGRWYVFGGVISGTITTPKTEVYDPQADHWTLLDQRWSLNQSREWPGGAQVGNRIYATGGRLPDQEVVVSTIEWLFVGASLNYLPLITNGAPAANGHEPNDALPLAYGPLASGVPLVSDFAQGGDNEDFFYIETGINATIQVTLTNIPAGSNYDLYLYGRDNGNAKHLFASSTNLSNADEHLAAGPVPAGVYYIRVRNTTYDSNEPYSLLVATD